MDADYSDCYWTRNFWEVLFISNALKKAIWVSQNTGIFPKLLSVFLFLIDFISESSGKWVVMTSVQNGNYVFVW